MGDYKAVPNDDFGACEDTTTQRDSWRHETTRRGFASISQLTTILISVISGIILTVGLGSLPSSPIAICRARHGSAFDLKEGEFAAAKSFIEADTVHFTGRTMMDSNGSMHLEHPTGAKWYTGPGEDVDQHWEDLIHGRWFFASEEEVKTFWPDNYRDFVHTNTMGWRISLEVFHSLHCVNFMRKIGRLDGGVPEKDRDHFDHCIETLRQTIQCSGDLTPLPARLYKRDGGIGVRGYIDSAQTHTCRNFEALSRFLDSRTEMDKQRKKAYESRTGKESHWLHELDLEVPVTAFDPETGDISFSELKESDINPDLRSL